MKYNGVIGGWIGTGHDYLWLLGVDLQTVPMERRSYSDWKRAKNHIAETKWHLFPLITLALKNPSHDVKNSAEGYWRLPKADVRCSYRRLPKDDVRSI